MAASTSGKEKRDDDEYGEDVPSSTTTAGLLC